VTHVKLFYDYRICGAVKICQITIREKLVHRGTTGGKQVDDCQLLMKFKPLIHSTMVIFSIAMTIVYIWENGGTFFW